jgi:PAS domain S-box-containing protein
MTTGQRFASYIAKLSKDPLIMKDSIQLDAIVDDANKDENIAYTIIRDEQGAPLTTQYASINYRLPRLNAILSGLSRDSEFQDIIDAIKKKEPVIEVSIPVMIDIKTIGAVTIGMSRHEMHQQIVKTILFVIALNVAVAFVLGAVLFVVSKKMVFNPLIELAHASSRLAKGDLSTEVKVRTTGEVKTLVNSFNEMVKNLEKVTVSRDYVDSIIESMIDALIVVDPDGKIRTVNKATCDLLGYKEEELRGNPFEMIFSAVAEAPLKREEMERLIEEGTLRNYEAYFKNKNGIKIPVLFSSSVMKDKDNGINCTICLGRDITERKRTEEELKQREEDLARSNKELEQFAYAASHDLQEPLRMVKSYVQLLARRYKGRLATEADEFIEFALDGATRMQRLINDLLTYSRVGTRGKEFEPTNCGRILEQVLNNLEVIIEENNAVVTFDPLPTLMADQVQLGQLFQNLIVNAIKFHGEEPPRIHISAKPIAEFGIQNGELNSELQMARLSSPKSQLSELKEGWVFSVSDNGIGIAPEHTDRIFIIFQRLHSREEYPGTGIGLAICKKIVERHGGRIWVESEPGKGATFYFTIPTKGDQQP